MRRALTSKVAFLTLAVAASVACSNGGDETEDGASALNDGNVEWMQGNWNGRTDWYTLTQGSQVVEYDVFRAIEQPGNQERFATRANLSRYGFLYPPKAAAKLTENDLPLGFVRDRNEGEKRDYLGLTCAACHTGALDVGEKRILVEGGQGFFDLHEFLLGLQASIDATLEQPAKRARACAAMSTDPKRCAERLNAAKSKIDDHLDRNQVALAGGPGRTDAITQILNELFSNQVASEQALAHAVPVSIPQVWNAAQLQCVQTNCVGKAPILRNIGETLGVYGHSGFRKVDGKYVIEGTPKVDNLHNLERALDALPSPKWDEKTLGKLNASKRNAGEKIFADKCAGCHAEPYKASPRSDAFVEEEARGTKTKVWKVTTVPYRQVGTDPAFIEIHGARWVKDDDFSDFFDDFVKSKAADFLNLDRDKKLTKVGLAAAAQAVKAMHMAQGLRTWRGDVRALFALGAVASALEMKALDERAKNDDERDRLQLEYEYGRSSGGGFVMDRYRARPLNGIAFTAPFGHNGAWPTLAEMLKKPSERIKSYWVRPRSFDKTKVGLDLRAPAPGEKLFFLDGTKRGNLNAGHDYGTDLSGSDKESLIEYLKSI